MMLLKENQQELNLEGGVGFWDTWYRGRLKMKYLLTPLRFVYPFTDVDFHVPKVWREIKQANDRIMQKLEREAVLADSLLASQGCFLV